MADLQLGFLLDPETGERGAEPFTVDSADLTTQGVIVGMTGSGKTGLGIVLLEEALAAGIRSSSTPRGTWATSCSPSPSSRRPTSGPG